MIELLLVATLLIESVLAFYLFDRDLIAPAFIFAVIFLASALDVLTMMDVWQYSIHWNTYFVISGGVLLFILFAYLIKRGRVANMEFRPVSLSGDFSWKIDKIKLVIFLVLNIGIVVLVAVKTAQVVRANGFEGSLLWCIGKYAELLKFSGDYNLNIGKVASNLYQLCQAEAYIWGYLLVGRLVYEKKLDILMLLNFGATMISFFLNGSRTGGVFVVVALIPMFIILYRNKNKTFSIPRKFIVLGVLLVVVLLLTFQQMGAVISRTLKNTGLWEYVSIYLGAPILNLDNFLQMNHARPDFWGASTFSTQIGYLCSKLGWAKPILDLPFLSSNGHNLGNVYTTFYAYIYDFGYLGEVILVPVMAVIVQWVYLRAKQGQSHYFACLLYMFIFPTVAFSFFSNKFYEAFGIGFVKGLVWWIVISFILMRLQIVREKNLVGLKSRHVSLRW